MGDGSQKGLMDETRALQRTTERGPNVAGSPWNSEQVFLVAKGPLAAELGIGSERVSIVIVVNGVADRATDRQCRVSYQLEIGVSNFFGVFPAKHCEPVR